MPGRAEGGTGRVIPDLGRGEMWGVYGGMALGGLLALLFGRADRGRRRSTH
jgi:hypothetical protein